MAFTISYVFAILFSVLTMIELRKNFFNLGVNKNAQAIQKQLTMTLFAQVSSRFLNFYFSIIRVLAKE
jgi:hypothetical protein